MSRTRYTLAYDHNNMVPAPDGKSSVQSIFEDEDGKMICYGTTVPTDATAGYEYGCLFFHTDGSAGDVLYVNDGSETSCDFNAVISEDNFVSYLQNQTYGIEGAYPHATAADDGGPSPLIWDGAPIEEVLADPGKGLYYFEDFNKAGSETIIGCDLTQTAGSGTFTDDPAQAGGVFALDNAASTNDHATTLLWNGLQLKPAPGTTIYFEVRVKVTLDDGCYLIGLADDSSTDLLNSGTIATNTDHAVFFRDDGTTDADMGTQACDGTNVTSADDECTDVDKTAYETFGIVISGDGDTAGDTVKFYHKGALVTTVTDADGGGDDGIPDAIICPTLAVDNASDSVQTKLDIDWMKVLVYNATSGSCRE